MEYQTQVTTETVGAGCLFGCMRAEGRLPSSAPGAL